MSGPPEFLHHSHRSKAMQDLQTYGCFSAAGFRICLNGSNERGEDGLK
jgi:hypothetical protein